MTSSLRRDVAAIVSAHQFDPARRELYVEGRRDRVFLLWLAGKSLANDVRIVEIQFVDVPIGVGGERGRLLSLVQQVQGTPAKIRGFVDADFDRIFNQPNPPNVWFTDLRDLEAYLLHEECLRKLFHLAANTDQVDAGQLLATILAAGRRLAALRILSIRRGLNLPFQRTELQRHVDATSGGFTLNFESYVSALLQNAGISLRDLPDLIGATEAVALEFAATEDLQLVHGKDAVRLISEVLLEHGVGRDQAEGHFFMSFEAVMAQQFPTLLAVLEYLSAA